MMRRDRPRRRSDASGVFALCTGGACLTWGYECTHIDRCPLVLFMEGPETERGIAVSEAEFLDRFSDGANEALRVKLS